MAKARSIASGASTTTEGQGGTGQLVNKNSHRETLAHTVEYVGPLGPGFSFLNVVVWPTMRNVATVVWSFSVPRPRTDRRVFSAA